MAKKIAVGAIAAIIAAAGILAALDWAGAVELPVPFPWHVQEEAEEEPEPVWEKASSDVLAVKASDIEGIEETDISEADMAGLLEALSEKRWADPSFAEDGLSITAAGNGKYKVDDKANARSYTARLAMGNWTISEGWADVPAPAAQESTSAAAPSAEEQEASRESASQTQASPAPQAQAQPQQSAQPQARISSTAAFDEASAPKLTAQAATNALGAQVASRLVADLNTYLSPTGVSVSSGEEVYVDAAGKTLKGDVLKFKALAKSGANRIVVNCTYDVSNMKHAIVLLD